MSITFEHTWGGFYVIKFQIEKKIRCFFLFFELRKTLETYNTFLRHLFKEWLLFMYLQNLWGIKVSLTSKHFRPCQDRCIPVWIVQKRPILRLSSNICTPPIQEVNLQCASIENIECSLVLVNLFSCSYEIILLIDEDFKCRKSRYLNEKKKKMLIVILTFNNRLLKEMIIESFRLRRRFPFFQSESLAISLKKRWK